MEPIEMPNDSLKKAKFLYNLTMTIRKGLVDNKLDIKTFAENMDIHEGLAIRWVNGYTNFNLSTIIKLEAVLGIKIINLE